jgi:transcriptional regulator NrdR family protein
MSQYRCPECGESSSVIETRASQNSLRRRRKCANFHRFTTLEVPGDAPKKLVELVQWAVRNNITDDFTGYVTEIMLGLPEQPEAPQLRAVA